MKMEDVVPALVKILNGAMAEVTETQHAVVTARRNLKTEEERLRTAFARLLPIPGGAVLAAALRREEGGASFTLHWDGEHLVVAVEAGEFKGERRVSETEMRAWLREMGL